MPRKPTTKLERIKVLRYPPELETELWVDRIDDGSPHQPQSVLTSLLGPRHVQGHKWPQRVLATGNEFDTWQALTTWLRS